ncbi:MAG: hypothetical protein WAV43_08585, partial [Streptococcus parauberis]
YLVFVYVVLLQKATDNSLSTPLCIKRRIWFILPQFVKNFMAFVATRIRFFDRMTYIKIVQ